MTGHKPYCCRPEPGMSTGRVQFERGDELGIAMVVGESPAMWWWTAYVATTPSLGAPGTGVLCSAPS